MRHLFLLSIALSLTGCAETAIHAAIAPDHPASPQAAPAARASCSTLARDEFDRIATGAPAADGNRDAGSGDGRDGAKRAPATAYTCSMHAEVQQAAPGICPKCGMKLVPKETGK